MEPDPSLQRDFELVQEEIAQLRKKKVSEYGEDRYHEPDPRINLLMLFSDVYRKYIRLKTQTLDCLVKGEEPDLDGLRESYLDVSSYATMGVQIIDKMKEKAK